MIESMIMPYTLNLTNDINQVPLLTEWIEQLAEAAGLAMDKTFQLNLALEEAVVNVMNYAYPEQTDMPIIVEASVFDDRLELVIDDHGIPFDPTQQEEPDLTLSAEDRPIGGLGIMLVRQFMDSIRYEYVDAHNRLYMTMKK